MADPAFLSSREAARRVAELGEEFALLRNPSYVHPDYEVVPLAPKITGPVSGLTAAVMDMDGTTTTTEPLCLHSLETMVRRVMSPRAERQWEGLDPVRDYPNVIGNSTTRHVEYLIETYGERIEREEFARAYLQAALWTLVEGPDPRRREEVRTNLRALGWAALLEEKPVENILAGEGFSANRHRDCIADLLDRYAARLRMDDFSLRVRAAVDIYYHRYHEILSRIAAGETDLPDVDLPAGQRLIEPMPGVATFLCLIKGWLGEEAGDLEPLLREEMPPESRDDLPSPGVARKKLARLGRRFRDNPLGVGLVTSSIRYEAEVVLGEVFSVLQEQIRDWPVRSDLGDRFDDLANVYDAVVTAGDTSEIRLKPHRDLYSIALHALGVDRAEFDTVIGFEDSESGTIAIRAAGIGLCVALPFTDTAGHHFGAAGREVAAGLPEVLLRHGMFLDLSQ